MMPQALVNKHIVLINHCAYYPELVASLR